MWGCCSFAVVSISLRNRSTPTIIRELAVHDFDRDLAVVALVVGEVDVRHPTAADLLLDGVTIGQNRLQTIEWFHSHRR